MFFALQKILPQYTTKKLVFILLCYIFDKNLFLSADVSLEKLKITSSGPNLKQEHFSSLIHSVSNLAQ